MKLLTVKIPENEFDEFKRVCQENGQTMSRLTRHWVRSYIDTQGATSAQSLSLSFVKTQETDDE